MNAMHLTMAPVAIPTVTIEAQLDTQLESLQNDAARINFLVIQTRAEKYTLMGATYLWWLVAKDLPQYLANQYAAANITVELHKVKTDFRSIMELISQKRMKEKDLSEWVRCLELIHAEVKRAPEDYASKDAIDAIAHFINTNGGISGLARGNTKAGKALTTVKTAENDAYFTLDEKEFNPCIFDEASNYHSQLTSLPTIAANDITTDEHGYGLALVKDDGNGMVVVGGVNDPVLIQDALVRTYRSDFDAAPQSVRTVIEPLHVLNEPRVISRHRGKFIKESKIADPNNKDEKLLAEKRLIFRAETGDFLLSQIGVDAGPVVISEPRVPVIFNATSDLFLPRNTRQEVETKLLDAKDFNLFEASNSQQFDYVGTGFHASHTVTLETKVPIKDSDGVRAGTIKRHVHNLNHAPLSFRPFYEFYGQTWQVDVNKTHFVPMWHCTTGISFIQQIDQQFCSKWMNEIGANANRDMHKNFEVTLNAKFFEIRHEKGKDGYDQSSLFVVTSGSAHGAAKLEVRTADLMFVLHQLASMKVKGSIAITANHAAIRIQFETSANKFDCWLPAANENGERMALHFEKYWPSQTANPAAPAHVTVEAEDSEDLGPDDDETFDNAAAIEAINRLKK
jgi:hypothetical protein